MTCDFSAGRVGQQQTAAAVWDLKQQLASAASSTDSTVSCSRYMHQVVTLHHHTRINTRKTSSSLAASLLTHHRQAPHTIPPFLPSCLVMFCQTFAPVETAPVAEPLTPQQARKEYKPLTPEDLAQHPIDPEQYKLPAGYHWYETMIVLRAMMDDQGR
jgi:hypothetical protein